MPGQENYPQSKVYNDYLPRPNFTMTKAMSTMTKTTLCLNIVLLYIWPHFTMTKAMSTMTKTRLCFNNFLLYNNKVLKLSLVLVIVDMALVIVKCGLGI